jgi:tetratricopeptide (TPR) repeat protein
VFEQDRGPQEAQPAGASLPSEGLVARLERRYEQTQLYGRDVDELFRQLAGDIRASWPEDPVTRFTLSVRALRIAAAWAERARGPEKSLLIVSEVALAHIAVALYEVQPEGDWVEATADAWDESGLLERDAIAEVLLDRLDDDVLVELEAIIRRRAHQRKHEVAGMLETMQRGGPAGLASARDLALFHARILATLDRVEDALAILDRESASAPAVVLAYADVYERAERIDDAIDRLRRAAIVLADKRPVLERLFDLYLANDNLDAAVAQQFQLLAETGELLYWDVLCDAVEDRPDLMDALLERLREASASTYADVLMAQGDVSGVLNAASAKTFSYDHLWRIGAFLQPHDDRAAARVYERAIALQGRTAQSKQECADFGARLEGVLTFFDAIGRTTKPRRLARELVKAQKNNVPLKREMERIFGNRFG